MKRLPIFLLLTSTLSSHVMATAVDEAMTALATTQGKAIYDLCIANPPVEPKVIATCTTLYTTYNATLTTINAPLPIVPSIDPSPYSWSPFDICRYETAHLVFNSVAAEPYYCPTL